MTTYYEYSFEIKANKKIFNWIVTTYLAPIGSDEKNVKSVTSKVLRTLGKNYYPKLFPKDKKQQKQGIVKLL